MNAMLEVVLTAVFIGGFAGGVHCAGLCGAIANRCAEP